MDSYWCPGCRLTLPHRAFHERSSRKRPVATRCRECRRRDREAALYPDTCAQCLRRRPIAGHGCCMRCLKARALRPCRRCGEVKALLLEFWEKQAICIACKKKPT